MDILGILGKAEFLNPGGSVKDRAALFIIKDAEARGTLKPGGLIVEGTAGNTGIGLALVGNARGYRTLIVMPDTQSQEKKDMLRLCGAELMLVPAAPYRDPGNYVRVSERVAAERAEAEPGGVVWANQWDNAANWGAHYQTTGPEIWEQTGGDIDGFICAIGTGGTLAGTGKFLKEKRPGITIGLADPMGAAMYRYFKDGELESEGSSIAEGIGGIGYLGGVCGLRVAAERLGVSRTPLRLALGQLQHEGLLEPMPGGGFVVRSFTRQDVEDAIDLRGVLGYTDYFVVCSGNTDRQTKAIHDGIHQGLKKDHGMLPRRVEGLGEARWILMDYLDVIVHVFTPEAREFYRLEQLWGEAPRRAVAE